MKTLTVTEVARNFSAVIDGVERDQEEIVLKRNQKTIARLVPESPAQNALEVLGDLYRTLDDKTAEALVNAMGRSSKGRGKSIKSLRNPWDS
jgi:antitoxin (DNA-binding transcriptional repressor) of toxin-antitoxin stability system